MIAIGSDFHVARINPIYGFHAGLVIKDGKNWLEEGFHLENSISREEAIRGMTIWALCQL